jgi:carboxylesterase 2
MRLSLWALAGAAALSRASIVTTHYGDIEGFPSNYRPGVEVFKGIPFAQPPVGSLRWAHPLAPSNWTETLVADKFGPECPQQLASPSDETMNSSPLTSVANVTSEDCLYLNVWRPANATAEDKLPVYVWYYGGRFSSGSGAVIAYDGSGLASKGVIVVTTNYRTGPFGFYAHPDLAAESPHNTSGNYAVEDMQAALFWTSESIANFGGDPDRITVGGQSSGSSCALDMMFSPLSSDRMFAVIAESGARAPRDPLTASVATSYRNQTEAYQNGYDTMAYFNQTTISGQPADLPFSEAQCKMVNRKRKTQADEK